jgi:hypothetical protein
MPNTIHVASPTRSNSTKPRTAKSGPTEEEIRLRAYEIYLKRCGAPASALDDWMQAERELLQKPAKTRRTSKVKAA